MRELQGALYLLIGITTSWLGVALFAYVAAGIGPIDALIILLGGK